MAKKAPASVASMAPTGNFIEEIYKKIGQSDYNQDVAGWLTTGILPLNYAISGRYGWGLPMGRITEIFGPESSGKTLMATMAMAQTQRLGGLAIFLDFEHAIMITRAQQLGLVTDRDKWIYKQPETAEEGFQIIEFICDMVTREGITKPVTIVVDSVAAMITQEELETGIGDDNMRTKLALAACLSANLKKINKKINKTNVTLIFLNQIRTNPGVVYGDKEKTTGGNALKFYASCRIKLRKVEKIKEGDEIVGERVSAEIIKNKVSVPFREATYISSFEEGVNLHRTHIEAMKELGIIEASGSWFSYKGERLGQGMGNVEQLLRDKPDLYEQLLQELQDAA